MNAKAALIGALFALAGVGIAEIVWADTAGAYSSATSPGISLRISSRFGDFAIDAAVPLTTPTALRTPTATFTPSAPPTNISSPTARPTSFVDLVGQASWRERV